MLAKEMESISKEGIAITFFYMLEYDVFMFRLYKDGFTMVKSFSAFDCHDDFETTAVTVLIEAEKELIEQVEA